VVGLVTEALTAVMCVSFVPVPVKGNPEPTVSAVVEMYTYAPVTKLVPRIVVDTAPALAANAEGLRFEIGAATIVRIALVVTVPPSGYVTFKMYVPGEAAPDVVGFSGVILTGIEVADEVPFCTIVKCVPSVVFVAEIMIPEDIPGDSNAPFKVSGTVALAAVSVKVAVVSDDTEGAAFTVKAPASTYVPPLSVTVML